MTTLPEITDAMGVVESLLVAKIESNHGTTMEN
jgi:hypothetical protein